MSRMEEFPEDEAEARWGDPLYMAGMEYAIRSLDQVMTGEGNNPDDCLA